MTPAGRAATGTTRLSPALRAVPAVAIFARAPVPGKTKTRLIPTLGANGAAELHRALVSDTLRKVEKLNNKAAFYLFVSGGGFPKKTVPDIFEWRRQRGRNLAQRLDRAFAELLGRHSRVLVIGTDSPQFPPSTLSVALRELLITDAVLGPCPDGGFYLIGLARMVRGLFSGVRMGTGLAFCDMLGNLLARGFSCSVLEPCPDIDRGQDLSALKKSLIETPALRRLMPQTSRFVVKRLMQS
ncbi:MAG TPA: TIGR04282 family arsenosugar biosynthesis glycosyltransferase [Terriglobia bacterium]|nr:TIGR04282 family arsenosugar biosynthesis glycosyltransferase [Terriglobia bacterium]